MKIPKYITEKMSLGEKCKLLILRIRAKRAMKKMDYYIHKSHKYEDKMYKTDDKLVDFIQRLSVKYI